MITHEDLLNKKWNKFDMGMVVKHNRVEIYDNEDNRKIIIYKSNVTNDFEITQFVKNMNMEFFELYQETIEYAKENL